MVPQVIETQCTLSISDYRSLPLHRMALDVARTFTLSALLTRNVHKSAGTSDHLDHPTLENSLPDGCCFQSTIFQPNLRKNLSRRHAAIRKAKYMGSFPVVGPDQATRAELVRTQLQQIRDKARTKSVLLVISLAGIKVCSPDGKSVHMAHALRRISYATCEPEHAQFSFLAREPKGHFSLQYCHSFLTQTSEQAEELNSIVGNAFRMAYAAQLQRQPTFREVIASQLQDFPDTENNNCSKTDTRNWAKYQPLKAAVTPSVPKNQQQIQPTAPKEEMNVQLSTTGSPLRLPTVKVPPSSIPGLRPGHTYNVLTTSSTTENGNKTQSQQSTPSSDESNSPTELNSYKRLTDKPPLIKRITMGLTGVGVVGTHGQDDDSCPLVSPGTTPESPTVSGGYVNEGITDSDTTRNNLKKMINNHKEITTMLTELDNNRLLQSSPASTEHELKSKRISQISSSSSGSCPQTGTENNVIGNTPTPPPLPERTDSLNNREEGELRMAPWFQAGIPREITLEVLGQEPVGAFMVRESTSKPGCFALSLRVPRDFQPTGIAHYLIMRTNKGYKIKGFTKEFSTLTSLITHHSVMPELLPCPLSLSRYNPSFAKSDSSRDFADVDFDPDYNTLADFRKMMADLND